MLKLPFKNVDSFINKKEKPTQVFFCKICQIFKNIYFEKHLRATASEIG